jgi:CheY-like chemotaxis protein
VSTEVDGASGRVAVEIRDSGTGIPPQNLSRIFDAFFTTKAVGVGTGLGLSICHRIVTGLGGEITVDSSLGKGTTFRVLLPPSASALPAAVQLREVAASLRRGKVLVVDDEPAIAKALGRALEPEHEVTIAPNADQASRLIVAGSRYDVILCDLMMPQMTGMDLHADLQQSAPEQATRMVFLTGGAFTSEARSFLDGVPNQRIEKPFDTQQVRAIVNDWIR